MSDKPPLDPMDPGALLAQVKLLQAALVIALQELRRVKAELREAEAIAAAALSPGGPELN